MYLLSREAPLSRVIFVYPWERDLSAMLKQQETLCEITASIMFLCDIIQNVPSLES
jgi:hypothetical protein